MVTCTQSTFALIVFVKYELLVDGFGNQVCAYRQFLLHSVYVSR